jgi:hypothetical protein
MTGARRGLVAAVLLTVVLAAAESVALQAQCSMCRTLLATPEGERMAGAFRLGIWILLAAPLGAFGVIALAAIRSRRRIEALRRNVRDSAPDCFRCIT